MRVIIRCFITIMTMAGVLAWPVMSPGKVLAASSAEACARHAAPLACSCCLNGFVCECCEPVEPAPARSSCPCVPVTPQRDSSAGQAVPVSRQAAGARPMRAANDEPAWRGLVARASQAGTVMSRRELRVTDAARRSVARAMVCVWTT